MEIQKQKIIDMYKKKQIVENLYDPKNFKYAFKKYKHKKESKILLHAINSLKKNEIKTLDVACGKGRLIPTIFSSKKEIKYTGIDSSEEMIKNLKKRKSYLVNKKNISLKKGDATKIPFKDNSFDLVFSYHLLWHLPKKEQIKIIEELARVAKKGGIIVFDVLNTNFIWEKIKKIIGIKKTEGIYKMNLKGISKNKNILKIDKLDDFPLKNNWAYSFLNIFNKIEKIMPASFYHMIYFTIKKN